MFRPNFRPLQAVLFTPSNVETAIPDNATPLYKKAVDQANDLGDKIAMPWDTQLDPTSNTRLQQELTLLVQGNIKPEEFISTMKALKKFVEISEKHTPFLLRKAQRIEQYLDQR